MTDYIIDLSERHRALNRLSSEKLETLRLEKSADGSMRPRRDPDSRTVDCRNSGAGDAVIINADVAQLLAQAFIDLANERRIVAMDLAGAEEINRAFQAIDRIGKALAS